MAFKTKVAIMLSDKVTDGIYDKALIFTGLDQHSPYVVGRQYDPTIGDWSSGSYYVDLLDAYNDMLGIENPKDLIDFPVQLIEECIEDDLFAFSSYDDYVLCEIGPEKIYLSRNIIDNLCPEAFIDNISNRTKAETVIAAIRQLTTPAQKAIQDCILSMK